MFREENDIIVVTDELDEIKKFLVRKGYTVDPSNTEDTAHQLVMNVQKQWIITTTTVNIKI